MADAVTDDVAVTDAVNEMVGVTLGVTEIVGVKLEDTLVDTLGDPVNPCEFEGVTDPDFETEGVGDTWPAQVNEPAPQARELAVKLHALGNDTN